MIIGRFKQSLRYSTHTILQLSRMASTSPYQGKKVLVLGLGRFLPPGVSEIPNIEKILAELQQAETDLKDLGFEVHSVSVNPKNLTEDTLNPISEKMQAGHVFDVVSIGAAVHKLDQSAPAFEKLTYFLYSESSKMGKTPRVGYPSKATDIVEAVKRVLDDE